MNLKDLKEEAKLRGLTISGTKSELATRLRKSKENPPEIVRPQITSTPGEEKISLPANLPAQANSLPANHPAQKKSESDYRKMTNKALLELIKKRGIKLEGARNKDEYVARLLGESPQGSPKIGEVPTIPTSTPEPEAVVKTIAPKLNRNLPPPPSPLKEEKIKKMNLIQLKDELRARNLPFYGNKNELIKRLQAPNNSVAGVKTPVSSILGRGHLPGIFFSSAKKKEEESEEESELEEESEESEDETEDETEDESEDETEEETDDETDDTEEEEE